ncbi:hypothetical protein MP228_003775 [Amoeboaphelidium protococcarum]|nr:hypothetical protein MP228_011069 [Amoeboaphelidium protococcarum]KAI3648137.1 hypothetical protein MP228_005991 [Amoeboaphelidium protococcarum]KAI3651369.1 hypothetical protein MP228_003775 [Amoeboaphelidium protococcarum]
MPRFTKRKHTPQHDIKDDEDNAGQESSKEGNDSSTEQEEQDKANNQDNELVTDTIKSEHQQQQDDKIKQLQTILYPNNITNHWIKTKPTSDEHERHPQLKWYYTLQSSTTKLTCQFTVEGKIAKLFGADAISITLPQSLVKKWDKDSLNAAASLLDFYPGAKITDRTIPPRVSYYNATLKLTPETKIMDFNENETDLQEGADVIALCYIKGTMYPVNKSSKHANHFKQSLSAVAIQIFVKEQPQSTSNQDSNTTEEQSVTSSEASDIVESPVKKFKFE